jgi:hypothetical protein
VPPVAPLISVPAPAQTSPAAPAVATGPAPVTSRGSQTVAPVEEQAAADVSPDGRFADLDESQLKALLGEIDRLPAVPVTEPEPVAIRVGGKNPPALEGVR